MTSHGMVVVQWTDADGLGFSRKGPGGTPAEYWTAAEALLNTDLAQPPGPILDTGGHPVWTLRHVPVGRRSAWCFVVQGRRGDAKLGVAGTCRFAFALDDLDAADAWQRGIQATGVGQAEPRVSAQEIADRTRDVLYELTENRERIPVGLEPAGTAAVIACVLAAMPESEARARSWSTCTLLLPPGRTRQPAVSGSWPEQFRVWAPRLAATVAASFGPPVTVGEYTDEDFETFADQAGRGLIDPGMRHGSLDLRELIALVRHAPKPVTVDDVPGMLLAPKGAEELSARHPHLLDRWVRDRPGEAAGLLYQVTHPEAAGALFSAACQAQRGTAENLIGLPTAAQPWPQPWHPALVELLKEHPGPDGLENTVMELTAEVWADPEDAAAGRELLRALGLDERGHPYLYRALPDRIVADLDRYGTVTETIREEFAVHQEPLLLLAGLCPRLAGRIPPRTLVDLLKLAGLSKRLRRADAAALESIAETSVRTGLNPATVTEAADWLRAVTHLVSPQSSRYGRRLLAGGIRALGEYDSALADELRPAPAREPVPTAPPPAGDSPLKLLKLTGAVLVATTAVVTVPVLLATKLSGGDPDPAAFHTPGRVRVIEVPPPPVPDPAGDLQAVHRGLEQGRIVAVTVLTESDQVERGRSLYARMGTIVPPGTDIKQVQGVEVGRPLPARGLIRVIVVYAD